MTITQILPFDRELETLIPDYNELIRLGQIPVRVEDILLPGVSHEEHTFFGPDKNELTVSIFRKKDSNPSDRLLSAIYHIHGGGMIMGNRFCNLSGILESVLEFNIACVAIEYRLAPAHPDPAIIEDCYAGLQWTFVNATALGIDSSKIVINGLSAGAGLAAGVALLCRDKQQSPPLLGQWLFSPMIDDHNDSGSAHAFVGVGIWDREANMAGWNAYLGDRRGTDNVSIYAAPSRATDLSGLPSAYIDTGSTETLRDEDVAYAQKLWRDGTQCELHVWPGAYHGFEGLNSGAQLSIMARKVRMDWLRRLLFFDFFLDVVCSS